MLSDAATEAVMLKTVGPTHKGFYDEACKICPGGSDLPHEAILWACRARFAIFFYARDLAGVHEAVKKLFDAIGRLEGCGGQRVRDAMDGVEESLWMFFEEKEGEVKP